MHNDVSSIEIISADTAERKLLKLDKRENFLAWIKSLGGAAH